MTRNVSERPRRVAREGRRTEAPLRPNAWHPVHRHDVAVCELAIGGSSSIVAVATRQAEQRHLRYRVPCDSTLRWPRRRRILVLLLLSRQRARRGSKTRQPLRDIATPDGRRHGRAQPVPASSRNARQPSARRFSGSARAVGDQPLLGLFNASNIVRAADRRPDTGHGLADDALQREQPPGERAEPRRDDRSRSSRCARTATGSSCGSSRRRSTSAIRPPISAGRSARPSSSTRRSRSRLTSRSATRTRWSS